MKKLNISKIYIENKPNCILLALYLSFILISQIFVSDFFQLSYLCVGSCMWIFSSFLLAPVIIHVFSTFNINNLQRFQRISNRTLLLLFYGIPLAVLIIYYVAYYPGGFSPDSISQYSQVVTGRYNDWHPVLQTLFAFWLPLTITGGWIGSISLFQIIILSVTLGYCFHTIYIYAGKKYVICSMIFILCNPLLCVAVIPWKDVSFAIGTLLLMIFSLKIIVSKGFWLDTIPHMIIFTIVFVVTTIFRHNAILFTVPLLFAIMFQISPKKFLLTLLAIISLFAAVKGPLYSALRVEKPGSRQIETLGLPMTVIGAAVTYTPDALDEDILTFAYKIAPIDIWENYYESGNFNTFKFRPESDENIIEEYGTKRILGMMFRCIQLSPEVCLPSLVKLTEGIFTITDTHPVYIAPKIVENQYGIKRSFNPSIINYCIYGIHSFVQDFFSHFFLFYGVADLIVIISILAKCKLNKWGDWKKILFAFPLLAYNYGSSLLLTGNNDCPRFFYYTVLILPSVLVIFYKREDALK